MVVSNLPGWLCLQFLTTCGYCFDLSSYLVLPYLALPVLQLKTCGFSSYLILSVWMTTLASITKKLFRISLICITEKDEIIRIDLLLLMLLLIVLLLLFFVLLFVLLFILLLLILLLLILLLLLLSFNRSSLSSSSIYL